MPTLLDIVSGSLTKIGELGQGQTVSPEDGACGLREMNLILASLSTQRLMISWVNIRQFTLAANTQDFTLGPSGNLGTNQTRPTLVEGAQVNPFGGTWIPLNPLSKPQWDAIRTKNATADVPDDMYVEYTSPNLGLHFHPIPTISLPIRLGCWEQLTQFVTLFDIVAFPVGVETMLEDLLAVRLAPFYDQPVTNDIQDAANAAMAFVAGINNKSLGGALGESQLLTGPNIGAPTVPPGAAPAAPAQPPAPGQ